MLFLIVLSPLFGYFRGSLFCFFLCILLLFFVYGFEEQEKDRHMMNQKGIRSKKVLDSSFFPSRPPTRIPTVKPSTSPPSNNYGQLAPVNYFKYTGIVQSVIVPAGCNSIYIYMWYGIIFIRCGS
jgi:hypothetical protein